MNTQEQLALYKRTLRAVMLAQMLGGLGLASGLTVGVLLVRDMFGSDSLAGLSTALLAVGSAFAAFAIGSLSQRYGRRMGLFVGFAAGGVGSAGAVLAAVTGNLPLLLVSLLLYGSGTAANLQARYAGTDLARPEQRGRAISLSMVFTTFGAVAGPNLVNVLGQFAEWTGSPALSGPFMLSAAAFMLAGLALLLLLRPDPLLVARSLASAARQQAAAAVAGAGTEAGAQQTAVKQQQANADVEPQQTAQRSVRRKVAIGAAVMVLTQIVMVAIMTMTPIHMQHHGHGLGAVGVVISIHIAAMYLPSLVTGYLADKLGRLFVAYASGATLLLAGLLAAFAPPHSLPLLIVALALLGVGWNFGMISGTAQIVDATPAETRAKTQGALDVLVALSGAAGGATSGFVVVHSGFTALSLLGGGLSLLLIPVIVWSTYKKEAGRV